MKIIDAFLGEHAVFYAQFDAISVALPGVTMVGEVKIRGGLVAAALSSHAALEEELLFTRLEPLLGKNGPLAAMRFEHGQIEGSLQMLETLEDVEAACSLLARTIELARAHFLKEEHILFRIAGQSIPAEELESLGASWAVRRQVALPA